MMAITIIGGFGGRAAIKTLNLREERRKYVQRDTT